MTTNLLDQLAEAKDKVAQLEREIATKSCREVGHRWVFIGGCTAGCDDTCRCSVPVHECRCGDCDYGDNAEADDVRRVCRERNG